MMIPTTGWLSGDTLGTTLDESKLVNPLLPEPYVFAYGETDFKASPSSVIIGLFAGATNSFDVYWRAFRVEFKLHRVHSHGFLDRVE